MSMQQQQQQRMMMQQQQQQRMQMMQQQQQQQQQMMGGHQRPPMSQGGGLLEQRLQQQQMLRGGPNMVRHGGPMAMRPGGPPGMMRPGGPPPYITGASTGVPPGQGPSPAPVYTGSSPGGQMNPSPGQPGGRPVPSPNMAPTPSPGGGINSNVNTPMGGAPDSVADREYMDKVKQLEKYIEPLRRMITKIGTEDPFQPGEADAAGHPAEVRGRAQEDEPARHRLGTGGFQLGAASELLQPAAGGGAQVEEQPGPPAQPLALPHLRAPQL